MRFIITALLFSLSLATLAAGQTDPYPGSGGLFLGTPTQEEIASGKIDFDKSKFAALKIGTTTKNEVVAALGKPAGWLANEDHTSQLEYDYVGPNNAAGMRRIAHVFFTFDKKMVLTRIDYPEDM
jgi:hypothetical protein